MKNYILGELFLHHPLTDLVISVFNFTFQLLFFVSLTSPENGRFAPHFGFPSVLKQNFIYDLLFNHLTPSNYKLVFSWFKILGTFDQSWSLVASNHQPKLTPWVIQVVVYHLLDICKLSVWKHASIATITKAGRLFHANYTVEKLGFLPILLNYNSIWRPVTKCKHHHNKYRGSSWRSIPT